MGFCVTLVTSGSMADTGIYWDSQIEPFIELNMGLDNIINRFRADFVRGVTGIRASRGYTQLPKNSFMVKFFADKDNVIASFLSSTYYESFMRARVCMCVRVHVCVCMRTPHIYQCVYVYVCGVIYRRKCVRETQQSFPAHVQKAH